MTPSLEWPGFRIEYGEGTLQLCWSGTGIMDVKAERCVDASLRPRSGDASGQLLFRFKSAPADSTDLIVVRVGVPAAHFQGAERLIQRLRREHSVPERQVAEDEATDLARIPTGAEDWVLAPTGSASEDLFDEVMDRIGNDAD